MIAHSYLHTAAQIIAAYTGDEPLAAHLKKFFAQHKKAGSRDRKQLAHLCYCYYRMGKAIAENAVQDRFLAGLFLCSATPQPVLEALKPEWNSVISLPLAQKITLVKEHLTFDETLLFPFAAHLSTAINAAEFSHSMLVQPDTFLRIRPEKKGVVLNKMQTANINYQLVEENCIAVPPATKLEAVVAINKDVVIQDKNSQQTLSLLQPNLFKDDSFDAWDCCAASGGKSIQLYDLYPNVRLTVMDIRDSILANLRRRFAEAGITDYRWAIADVAEGKFNRSQFYDFVVCDAPCTGSGTWARTPEAAYFFAAEKIEHYSKLQQRIATNAAGQLKKGGLFLYITCSVFRAENEGVVEHLQKNGSLQLKSMQYFKGYEAKADTLFAALFIRL